MLSRIEGAGTALITPFTAKHLINWEWYESLINWQISQGINFLVPGGTTGESPTLSHSEHIELIHRTVEITQQRVPVMAGTGSNNTAEAVSLTRSAQEAGVDAVLLVTPYYNKPEPQGIKEYVAAVAEIGLPVYLYDIPGRTSRGVPTELILELAHEDLIAGLKWASGDFSQLMEIINTMPKRLSILSGDDAFTYPLLALGGHGAISVSSNCFPELMVKLVSFRNYNLVKARQTHYHLLPFLNELFKETNPIGIKYAMELVEDLGEQEMHLRSPMTRSNNRINIENTFRECKRLHALFNPPKSEIEIWPNEADASDMI